MQADSSSSSRNTLIGCLVLFALFVVLGLSSSVAPPKTTITTAAEARMTLSPSDALLQKRQQQREEEGKRTLQQLRRATPAPTPAPPRLPPLPIPDTMRRVVVEVGAGAQPLFAHLAAARPDSFFLIVEPDVPADEVMKVGCADLPRERCGVLKAKVTNQCGNENRKNENFESSNNNNNNDNNNKDLPLTTLDDIIDALPSHVLVELVAIDCNGTAGDFLILSTLRKQRHRVANILFECLDQQQQGGGGGGGARTDITEDTYNCQQALNCVFRFWKPHWDSNGCTRHPVSQKGLVSDRDNRLRHCYLNNGAHPLHARKKMVHPSVSSAMHVVDIEGLQEKSNDCPRAVWLRP